MSRNLDVVTAVGIDFGTTDERPAWIPDEFAETIDDENADLDAILACALKPEAIPPTPWDGAGEYLSGKSDPDGDAYYDAISSTNKGAGIEWDFYGVDDYGMGQVLVFTNTLVRIGWCAAIQPRPPVVDASATVSMAAALGRLGVDDAPLPTTLAYGRFW